MIFLSLPDFRENLVLDIIPGIPTGTAVEDLSGKGHTITKTDSPSRVAGGLFPVLDFSAAGSLVINHANDIDIDFGSMSYCFWSKVSEFAPFTGHLLNKAARPYMGQNVVGGKNQMFMYMFDNEEADEFELYQNSEHTQVINQWYFNAIVIKYDDVAVKLYQDGELILSKDRGAANLFYSNNNNIIVGKYGATQYQGQVAMVRMYNEALTAQQVKQIFQHTRRYVMGLSPKL